MQRAVYLEKPLKSVEEVRVVEIPKPLPKKGYAIVKIKVAASNPADRLGFVEAPIAGWSFPTVAGVDFSGIVEEVGEGVMNVKKGDAVLAINWNSGPSDPEPVVGGAYQEYLSIAAYKLSKKPESLSFEQAAALICVGGTAYQTLVDIAKVHPGTKLLVLGGSSAVGSFAIQLAKHLGAHVTTTASSRALSYVQQFRAADKIINYNEEKWEDDVSLRNIDVVLDCVGEEQALERVQAKGVLKTDGIFVTIANFAVGFNPAGHPPLSFAAFFAGYQDTAALTKAADLVASGVIRVPIEQTFPFTTEGVQQMYAKTLGGKSLGKNLLIISE